ncbi:GlsB/YeaQ/YmgE family stress response membrane protein [Corynebacterium appendicis]|uniref:GlsB/YeaQ/YmgE family stress response membrane protein n=1 Tax=Corynebacterium appendicis TaxID=163202 RepID=UPI00223C1BF0|nr:GlsB/YeaQ/YmgE family stress response membrane protein [Corynebacterium appendicis]MCT1683925.1 GlsB/YeaQ/YmgE family stress response membrane protein [Corynebacterium appendicis]
MSTISLGFLGWIVLGGIAGWIASMIMNRDASMGILANIACGVVGGLLGGFLLSLFFDVESKGWFFSLLTSILGAVIVLWIVNKVTAGRR